MKKSNLVELIVTSALSFSSPEILAKQHADVERPKKIESIVRERVKLIVSLEDKGGKIVCDYVNKDGDYLNCEAQRDLIPARSYRIKGFNIIGRCDCSPLAFIAEEYKIKQVNGLFQVINVEDKVIARGESLIKRGNKIYATIKDKTEIINIR
jgi:hypothetical protein